MLQYFLLYLFFYCFLPHLQLMQFLQGFILNYFFHQQLYFICSYQLFNLSFIWQLQLVGILPHFLFFHIGIFKLQFYFILVIFRLQVQLLQLSFSFCFSSFCCQVFYHFFLIPHFLSNLRQYNRYINFIFIKTFSSKLKWFQNMLRQNQSIIIF